MKHSLPLLVFLFFALFFSLSSFVHAVECGTIPTNNCLVTQNTVFTPGTYAVNNITIAEDNVILNCNSAVLNGSVTALEPIIYVGGVSGVVIRNCNFENYNFAISDEVLLEPQKPIGYFIIASNTFTSNLRGTAIRLGSPLAVNLTRSPIRAHFIVNNTIIDPHVIGIILDNANNSIIGSNTITLNSPTDTGIYLIGGSDSKVEYNTIDGGRFILLRYAGDTGYDNIVQYNRVENVNTGLEVWEGMENTLVSSNNFTINSLGVYLRANSTRVQGNTIRGGSLDSTTGVSIEQVTSPRNSTILWNTFENIDDPGFDGGTQSQWNGNRVIFGVNRLAGNYYSQFSQSNQCRSYGGSPLYCCTDVDADNICDEPFVFQGNNDSYALRSQYIFTELPPTIQPIAPITVSESEAVVLTITAASQNGVIASYEVTDPRFLPVVGNPNQFSWQTNFQDAGVYTVTVYALDSFNLQSKTTVNITVLEANDDCSLYPARIANGCVVRSSVSFPAGNYFVPDGITIDADNVQVSCTNAVMSGFSGKPATGITLANHNGVTIQDCIIKKYVTGVNLTSANQTTITNVQALENDQSGSGSYGIALVSSNNNIIQNSQFSDNGDTGIHLYDSHDNILRDNVVSNNKNLAGIGLFTSSRNMITNNTLVGNENGGILLGILSNSGPNNNNVVQENTIQDGVQNYGINLRRGNNNLIFHNNLINNARNPQVNEVPGNSGNQWFSNNEGNYYSNHVCTGNRVCTNAYAFFSGSDPYPFREQNGWQYPEPYIITPQQTVQAGQTINLTLVGTQKYAGQLYVFALALGNSTGIPLSQGRKIYLDGDIILQWSLQFPQAFGLSNNIGYLDQDGNAQISWTIPTSVPLQGTTFYTGGVIFDLTLPIGLPITGIFVPTPETIV